MGLSYSILFALEYILKFYNKGIYSIIFFLILLLSQFFSFYSDRKSLISDMHNLWAVFSLLNTLLPTMNKMCEEYFSAQSSRSQNFMQNYTKELMICKYTNFHLALTLQSLQTEVKILPALGLFWKRDSIMVSILHTVVGMQEICIQIAQLIAWNTAHTQHSLNIFVSHQNKKNVLHFTWNSHI